MAEVFEVHPGAAYPPLYNMEVFNTSTAVEWLVTLWPLKDHLVQKEDCVTYKKAMQKEDYVTDEKANL